MKLQPRTVDRFISGGAEAPAALVYGPDAGLVRERAEAIRQAVAGRPPDPFRSAHLSADTLLDDPARLADEAGALALTGGRRVVSVAGAGDRHAPLFEAFLGDAERTAGDSLVLVESGELPARSRLRKLFEGDPRAVAIACYRDEGRALDEVIRAALAETGVTAEPAAVDYLRENLGGDRLVTRRELEKLALYAGADGRVALEDAVACVGDSAVLVFDDVARATAGGDLGRLDRALARLWLEGTHPTPVLRAVARYFRTLRDGCAQLANGRPAAQVADALRLPRLAKVREPFQRALERWPARDLERALLRLTEAEAGCKTTGSPAQLICGRALIEVARHGRRLRRGDAG